MTTLAAQRDYSSCFQQFSSYKFFFPINDTNKWQRPHQKHQRYFLTYAEAILFGSVRKQTLFTSDFPARIGLLLYLQRPQKKSIPQKWSKKPKPPDANISIFGGGGGGWSFFCPFKNKSKLLVYAIYVKICKNGQRFRYRRYNWKYQPHLVHFILIFMNTLGKVSAIYLLFNIVYCSCSLSDGFSCFGWQINLNE